jgi:GTPase SAR1 family protein
MEGTKPLEGTMSVKVIDVDLLEISLPGIFGLSGKTYNRLIVVLTGPAGVGKTTLAHGILHATFEALQPQGRSQGKSAKRRQESQSLPPIEINLVHLLLEFGRIHSVEHDSDCSISRIVRGSSSGVKASVVIDTLEDALGRSSPRGVIRLPVIAVDAATDLRGDDTDRLGNIWRGIQMFLDWMNRFTYYIVIFIAQERANINAGPYAPRHRAGFPDSHLHSAHFLIRMAPSGEGKVRIVTRAVNAIADKSQAEVSLTMDTLRALISGGETLGFGFGWVGKTRVYLEA